MVVFLISVSGGGGVRVRVKGSLGGDDCWVGVMLTMQHCEWARQVGKERKKLGWIGTTKDDVVWLLRKMTALSRLLSLIIIEYFRCKKIFYEGV